MGFEPLMIVNGAAFSLSDSSIVDPSSPVVLTELPTTEEEIAITVVIARPVPILEGQLPYLGVKPLSDESAVSPDLVYCIPRHREIIINIFLLSPLSLINGQLLAAGVYLMCPEDDTLPALLRSIRPLEVLRIGKDQYIAILRRLDHKFIHIEDSFPLLVILTLAVSVPILDPLICAPAILLQRGMGHNRD